MNARTPIQIVQECRRLLIQKRADVLNQLMVHQSDFAERDTGGDEMDQTASQLNENRLYTHQRRLRTLLFEIDHALGRIESGKFGICEETLEPIETERLLAIPWTRVSLEGAEIREASLSKANSR